MQQITAVRCIQTHTHAHYTCTYTHDIHMYTTNSLCFDASTNMMLMGELSIKCCHKYHHNMHVNMHVVTVFIYSDYDT